MVYRSFERGRSPVNLMFQAIKLDLPDAPENVALFSSLALVGAIADAEAINLPAASKSVIYMMVVGPAGSGKTSTITHAVSRLNRLGLGIKLTHRPSREGLAKDLADGELVVHIADEVHEIIKAKKTGEYLSGVIELWKMVYDRKLLKYGRRRKEAEIVVPPDARLIVYATTTYEDFDDVRNVIDSALMRRFVIVTTSNLINMFKESANPIESQFLWQAVAGQLMFLKRFRWKFWICSSERLFDIAKIASVLATGTTDGEVIAHIQQVSIRLAMILALNDIAGAFFEAAEREFEEDLMLSSPEVVFSRMEATFINKTDSIPGLSSEKFRSCCSEINEDVVPRLKDLMLSTLGRFIKQEMNYRELIETLGREFENLGNSFRIVGRASDDTVYIVLPMKYLAKGMILATIALVESSNIRTSLGLDPLLAKIVRYMCNIKARGQNIRTREIAMRVGKKYSVLRDALKTLMVAGIIRVVSCSEEVTEMDIENLNEKALGRCVFDIDNTVCLST